MKHTKVIAAIASAGSLFAMSSAHAIVPAAAVTIWYGESGTSKLLILSQVALSLQLPFAVIPLVLFTASRRKLGALVAPLWLTVLAGLISAVLVALNVKLILDCLTG